MRSLGFGLVLVTALAAGCEGGDAGGEKKGLTIGVAKVDCALTMDTLVGTDWVIERINPDKSVTADSGTRLRIYKDGDKLLAKYNVSSLSDMYTYECELKNGELLCLEPPKLKDFCQSLAVYDKGPGCTPEGLKALAPKATDEEIAKAIAEANETIAKFKDKPEWKNFVFNNNNLGNKLQGRLDATLQTKSCKLRVTDMFRTIYNGERKEDSNPVGTNDFVQTKDELLWEHCTDSGDLIPRKAASFPEKEADIQGCYPPGCTYAVGEDVFLHYLGQDGRAAAEGCTYSFDMWQNGKPLAKDTTAEIVDYKGKKEVRWVHSGKYDAAGANVLVMVRNKTCNGQKEQLEVSCALVNVQ